MPICLSETSKFATNSPISFIYWSKVKAQENLKIYLWGKPHFVLGLLARDIAQNIPLTQALNPLSSSKQILFYRKHSLGAPDVFTGSLHSYVVKWPSFNVYWKRERLGDKFCSNSLKRLGNYNFVGVWWHLSDRAWLFVISGCGV